MSPSLGEKWMGSKMQHMFNKVITFMLLITMLMGVFNGTMIYIWFKFNQEYIAAMLCEQRNDPGSSCNGKCHLQKKLAESETTTPESPKAITQTETLSFFLPPARQTQEQKKELLFTTVYSLYVQPFAGTEIPAEIFHPPRPTNLHTS